MEFILVTVILVLLLTLIERSIPTGPKSQPKKATAPAPQGDDTKNHSTFRDIFVRKTLKNI